ncbi:hypothetical protein [Chryseobacterium sp. sg2396]|uniref:hypothetical protein n=1 Tax=Chryseobacterium sp. sg2396 TaxID=3276280 RepID=UPI00366BD7E9
MSNLLAGLFGYHSDYKKLEADLEGSGFENSDYIVYLNGEDNHSQYLVTIAAKSNEQIEQIQDIFRENSVLKTYIFDNMGIEQSDYTTIKRLIDARNKAEIHNAPDVKIKGSTAGMDSEVKF